jgi:hypothetical protein
MAANRAALSCQSERWKERLRMMKETLHSFVHFLYCWLNLSKNRLAQKALNLFVLEIPHQV